MARNLGHGKVPSTTASSPTSCGCSNLLGLSPRSCASTRNSLVRDPPCQHDPPPRPHQGPGGHRLRRLRDARDMATGPPTGAPAPATRRPHPATTLPPPTRRRTVKRNVTYQHSVRIVNKAWCFRDRVTYKTQPPWSLALAAWACGKVGLYGACAWPPYAPRRGTRQWPEP
ncbi:hypothetical protein SAFG77S_08167 [Streptomyces afghaniensis]